MSDHDQNNQDLRQAAIDYQREHPDKHVAGAERNPKTGKIEIVFEPEVGSETVTGLHKRVVNIGDEVVTIVDGVRTLHPDRQLTPAEKRAQGYEPNAPREAWMRVLGDEDDGEGVSLKNWRVGGGPSLKKPN